jgi:hypothetical protein
MNLMKSEATMPASRPRSDDGAGNGLAYARSAITRDELVKLFQLFAKGKTAVLVVRVRVAKTGPTPTTPKTKARKRRAPEFRTSHAHDGRAKAQPGRPRADGLAVGSTEAALLKAAHEGKEPVPDEILVKMVPEARAKEEKRNQRLAQAQPPPSRGQRPGSRRFS